MTAEQIIAIEIGLCANAFLRYWNADGNEVTAYCSATRVVALHWDEDPDHVNLSNRAEQEESFKV